MNIEKFRHIYAHFENQEVFEKKLLNKFYNYKSLIRDIKENLLYKKLLLVDNDFELNQIHSISKRLFKRLSNKSITAFSINLKSYRFQSNLNKQFSFQMPFVKDLFFKKNSFINNFETLNRVILKSKRLSLITSSKKGGYNVYF